MKAFFIRTVNGFIPAEEDAEKIYKRVGLGEYVQMDYKPARNYNFHKKFFSMVQHVFENQERYETLEDLLIEIKLKSGHYQEHLTTKGKIIYVPKSISFDNMDELKFQAFYDKAVQSIISGKLADEQTMNYVAMNF